MQASPLTDNPFAVLTAVVAPAVLTNACSVLCLGTANRIARVVDRTRVLASEMKGIKQDSPDYQFHVDQLSRLRSRSHLLFRALRLMYAALGGYAASALVSVVGSALAFYHYQSAFRWMAAIALVVGVVATLGLVLGCSVLVSEVRLALRNISEEADRNLTAALL